jgi:hypothetical protein
MRQLPVIFIPGGLESRALPDTAARSRASKARRKAQAQAQVTVPTGENSLRA